MHQRITGSFSCLALSTKTILLATILAFSSLASADELSDLPKGDYQLDLSHASVVWKVSHFGFSSYVGRFTDFDAVLSLDTQDFTKSSVNVTINVDSIQTAFPWVEEEDFDKVLADGWFKTAEHPTITFVSSEVGPLDGNQSKVTGMLTLMGETKPVVLDVTLNKAVVAHPFKKKPTIGFSATTTIDRTVWGLTKYAPNIGAEVKIDIEGEFLM